MLNRRATWIECGLAALVFCFGLSFYLEHTRGRDDTKLATLHTHTVVAQAVAAAAESVFTKDTLPIKAARDSLRRLRDSVLAHPADTVKVKEYVTRTDRVIALDSTALVAASVVIDDLHDVVTKKDAELKEALKPRYPPRLTASAAALYDPLAGQPSGSAGVSVRVLGGLSLVGRIDQRPVLERPSVRVGVALSF